jgi:Kef-type K+ transport system membrane component KefB
MIAGLLVSKFLATLVAKVLYRYSWDETLTMWSLSLPQVAATLAAALAGVQAGLIPQEVFNSVIVLMLVTSLLGPVLTERFGRKLPLATTGLDTGGRERITTRNPESGFGESTRKSVYGCGSGL